MHIPVLLETRHYLVINKPAGLNVEQLYDYDSAEQWATEYQKRQGIRKPYTGIVHRLDRPVSGALIIAKKKSTLKSLNEQFRQRQVEKEYITLVAQAPTPSRDTLTHWIVKDQKQKRAYAFPDKRKGAVQGVLRYEVIGQVGNDTLLRLYPLTGKFHQIRVQLSAIGCPIVGDERYGSGRRFAPNAIALHAYRLRFTDPQNGDKIEVVAPPPFSVGDHMI